MNKFVVRILRYFGGIFILTIGIGFAIESNLGSSPITALPYTINVISGFDLGIATTLFQSFLVFLQFLVLRKDFKIISLLQVPVSIVFGWMTGFSRDLIAMLPDTDNFPLRILLVLVGSFFIALGIALYVPANIMPLASEGILKAISDKTGIAFSNLKIALDCIMVSISAILCLAFTRQLISVGLGTVILAVTVGLINKQILKIFSKFTKKAE